LPEGLDPDRAAYPLFIKPRWGSAGKGAFRVNDARELRFFLSYLPDPIIQELVSGPEITNDVVCDLSGEVLSVVSRRRIEVRWGEVAKGVTLWDARIAEDCARVARALDARGPITVQCLLQDGHPCFTEVNARLGGGAPLGIAAGADYPLWLLARAAGIPVTIPPLGNYQQGLYVTRFDDAFYLDQEAYDRLDGCRL
jgi:carbamoyl-phosphate synthase large subunit